MQAQELIVFGTGWRPSLVPLLLLSHNNLNPAASFDEHGITVKIIRTTKLPWDTIEKASVRKGLITTYCVISAGRSEFVLHFREREDLGVLVAALRNHGIAVNVPDSIENDLK